VFFVTQFVPGGPVERRIMQYQMGAAASGRSVEALPEDAIQQIREYYGFDKPVHERYALWLRNLAHLDLGNSYVYQEPVWDVIKSRFPVSIFLGLTGFLLSYLICIPLGVIKAVKHGSRFDFISSAVVFLGYSVPGWALGTALLVLFGGGSYWNVFPLGGFRPPDWDFLSIGEKIVAQARHMFLPVVCYMVGSFATLTILTKNSLLENLGQDYVRTAFAKGLDEQRVIFVHALRNSLIPLATGLGHVFSLILAGSFLIERVFNIDGMGYLGYTSILQRDYPVALGILVIGSLLLLIGNILSDMIYALVDPRIRFK
jgi:microcin C transport system permease protein